MYFFGFITLLSVVHLTITLRFQNSEKCTSHSLMSNHKQLPQRRKEGVMVSIRLSGHLPIMTFKACEMSGSHSSFDVLLTVHLSIFILVINQRDAQNFCFTVSLFHASTWFEHLIDTTTNQQFIRFYDQIDSANINVNRHSTFLISLITG